MYTVIDAQDQIACVPLPEAGVFNVRLDEVIDSMFGLCVAEKFRKFSEVTRNMSCGEMLEKSFEEWTGEVRARLSGLQFFPSPYLNSHLSSRDSVLVGILLRQMDENALVVYGHSIVPQQ